MDRTPAHGDADIGSDALLAAYQLLIETTVESGADDQLLQRALAVVAAIRWPSSHRFFSAFLPAADASSLRLAALVTSPGVPSPPCADLTAAACICGRALIAPGRLLCVAAKSEAALAPCDVSGTGTHLVLPLAARGRILGVLHALIEADQPPGEHERSFLIQVATLLGAELHRRHSEREHDRLEMQFLQAQKMDAVGRLAGGVAHDFNNILTAITSYADLGLLKLPAQSPLCHNFEQIIAASDRAALLTQQLLAFSRRQVLAPRVIDVNIVIAELLKPLRRLLGVDMELSVNIDPSPTRILADPALIEQMIINLMVCVRDALPRGGAVTLETATTRFDAEYTISHPAVAPGKYVCTTIGARGSGLAAESFRAHCVPGIATLEVSAGAALGPAAINDIIRQSGGHARVEPAGDGEVTLRIFFPAVEAVAASPTTTADGASTLPRGSETILLAEDDDSVRIVVAEILRDLGYQVLEAREGREALAIAAAHTGRIDVLVTDLMMPLFGGVELQGRLCKARPDLRALFISGVTDDSIVRHGLVGPDTLFLEKPFSPWALANRLRQVLDAPPPEPA